MTAMSGPNFSKFIRAFIRLEKAVGNHAEAKEKAGFSDEADDALHSAWRSVLKSVGAASREPFWIDDIFVTPNGRFLYIYEDEVDGKPWYGIQENFGVDAPRWSTSHIPVDGGPDKEEVKQRLEDYVREAIGLEGRGED